MLFRLFIEDVISIEQQIYVFVLRHLHTITVYSYTEFFVAALGTIGFDFLWRFIGNHCNG